MKIETEFSKAVAELRVARDRWQNIVFGCRADCRKWYDDNVRPLYDKALSLSLSHR